MRVACEGDFSLWYGSFWVVSHFIRASLLLKNLYTLSLQSALCSLLCLWGAGRGRAGGGLSVSASLSSLRRASAGAWRWCRWGRARAEEDQSECSLSGVVWLLPTLVRRVSHLDHRLTRSPGLLRLASRIQPAACRGTALCSSLSQLSVSLASSALARLRTASQVNSPLPKESTPHS